MEAGRAEIALLSPCEVFAAFTAESEKVNKVHSTWWVVAPGQASVLHPSGFVRNWELYYHSRLSADE